MKKIIVFAAVLTSGCATGLNSMQHQELLGYEAKGLAIEEKSTGTATALGLLPGGGSFYTRQYGLGVLNLLIWPYSVLWDPISGYNGAQEINYHATVANCSKLKNTEIADLDALLMSQQVDNIQYMLKKRAIENKYSPIESVGTSQAPYAEKTPIINKAVVKEPVALYEKTPVTEAVAETPIPSYESNQNVQSARPGVDLRDCLKLPTNEAMVKCAERGR